MEEKKEMAEDVIDVEFANIPHSDTEQKEEEVSNFEAKLAFLKLPVVLHYLFSNKTTKEEEDFKLQQLSQYLQEICDTEKIRFALQNLNMAVSEEIQKKDKDIRGVLAVPAFLPELDDNINAQSQKFFENLLEYNFKLMEKAKETI